MNSDCLTQAYKSHNQASIGHENIQRLWKANGWNTHELVNTFTLFHDECAKPKLMSQKGHLDFI